MATSYFSTYNAIFDTSVSSNAKLVYSYLCKCANALGQCFPSHKSIGEACGIGVTTVKKAISELEAAELVKSRGQARPDGGRRVNLYTLIKDGIKGFFSAQATIFIEKLSSKAKLVYLYFCRLSGGDNSVFPAHKTTAKACGLSYSATRKAIDELEQAALIERQAQFRDNGGQKSNLYTIAIEPKKAIIEIEKTETKDIGTKDIETTTENENKPEIEASSQNTDCDVPKGKKICSAIHDAVTKTFYSFLSACIPKTQCIQQRSLLSMKASFLE